MKKSLIIAALLLTNCKAVNAGNIDIAEELCYVVMSTVPGVTVEQAQALCKLPDVIKPFLVKGDPAVQKEQAVSAAKKLGKI